MQKLQKKAIKKGIFSFDVRIMNCDNEFVLQYAYILHYGAEPCVNLLTEKLYKEQCEKLGDDLKEIRAFLKEKPGKKDQTEAVSMEAVKSVGHALRCVNSSFFEGE